MKTIKALIALVVIPTISIAAEFADPIVGIECRGYNFTGGWVGFDPAVERGSIIITIATDGGWKSLRIAKDDESKKDMLAMALTSKTTGVPILISAQGEWHKIEMMRMAN